MVAVSNVEWDVRKTWKIKAGQAKYAKRCDIPFLTGEQNAKFRENGRKTWMCKDPAVLRF
jgi:hypothetical protein